MNKIISMLIILVGLVTLSGCTVKNVEGDDNYVELYPQANIGWYVNKVRPYFVFNDSIFVPAVYDDRIIGQWLIGSNDGGPDSVLTISSDNLLFVNNELIGEWYWGSSNILMTVLYEDGVLAQRASALRIDFIDDTNDFAQFTEYANDGSNGAFLGVRVD